MKLKSILCILLTVCLCSCGSRHRGSLPENRNEEMDGAEAGHIEENYQYLSDDGPTSERGNSQKQVFLRKYNSAIFMAYTNDERHLFQGSGFFVDSIGLALINYNVLNETTKDKTVIRIPGDDDYCRIAEIIKSSADNDFTLFRVDLSKTNCIPIAETKPRLESRIFFLGSEQGLKNSISEGKILLWQEKNSMQFSIQTNQHLNGGVILNENGRAIGIESSTLSKNLKDSLFYATSIDVIKPYFTR